MASKLGGNADGQMAAVAAAMLRSAAGRRPQLAVSRKCAFGVDAKLSPSLWRQLRGQHLCDPSELRRTCCTTTASYDVVERHAAEIADAGFCCGQEVPQPSPGSNGLLSREVQLKDMSFPEMEAWVQDMGHPKGRALVLWRWLYGNGKLAQGPDEMTGVSQDFRAMLQEWALFNALTVKDIRKAADGTRKLLFEVEGGAMVEAVVIPADGRTTVCVSSQVGCAMNCQFCFTGRMGLKRNLTTGEIVDQLVAARRIVALEGGSVTNVVFMGMGEPLQNLGPVMRAAEIMVDLRGLHLSPAKITISTSGLVPQLREFCRSSPCHLAVSLNATTDEVRSWIMPINRKYNLNCLMGALREEFPRRHQAKVFFEYVMLAGVNDSDEDARRLVELIKGIACKVNLICFNAHSGSPFQPTPHDSMLRFHKLLADAGVLVYIRHSRGDDQMAACGQLGTVVSSNGHRLPPRMRPPEHFREAFTYT